jgi:phage N-6-adenine-methyltransferase
MKLDAMYLSKSDDWETPQYLFDKLDAIFDFTVDVCASSKNAKCSPYYTKAEDGLRQSWTGVCWMNPPYGRQIGEWVKKAFDAAEKGATVVCLLPARTDTKWWQAYCTHGEISFIPGRLKFGDSKNSAPFPSALVVFRPSLKDLDLGGQNEKRVM